MLLHEVANFIVYLNVCKKMLYFVTILFGLLAHSSEVIVDIVPSVDSPCTTSCLTLSDFAAHHTSGKDIIDGMILILGSGNHTLTSTTLVNITNINLFSILSKTQTTSIICSQQASFKFTNIRMVEIVNISFIDCEMMDPAMLEFEYVDNATIKECRFINSKGNIILAHQSKITISRSSFMNSSSNNGITLFKQSKVVINISDFIGNKPGNFGVVYASDNTTLAVFRSSFEDNIVDLIGIVLIQNSQAWFTDVKIVGNQCHFGALYLHESALETYERMIISRNIAVLSSVYLVRSSMNFTGIFLHTHNKGSFLITNSVITFSGTSWFSNNRAGKRGGAITSIQSRVHITNNSSFLNNSARLGGAISAYESEIHMHGKVTIANNKADAKGGGVYLYQSELVCQDTCTFIENTGSLSGGGIHAFGSMIILGSKVWKLSGLKNNSFLLANNEALRGGGLSLEANSRIHGIGEYGYDYKFEFSGNQASYGGAIHVDDYTNDDICTSNSTAHITSTECFLQTLYYTPESSVEFIDNYASIAGHTLFGGLLDRCTVSVFAHIHEDQYLIAGIPKHLTPMDGLEYFRNVTNITDIDSIDSDAIKICFCINGEYNICNRYIDMNDTVMKGEAFNITLVAINQVANPVNATVISKILSNKGHLDGTQYERNVSNVNGCTNLTFNVYSPDNSDSLIIYAKGPCREKGISKSKVSIIFKECECPLGFENSEQNTNFSCKCGCHHQLQNFTTNCNITTKSFLRESNFWIKYINYRGQGYLTYSNCPFDYCHPPHPAVWINLNTLYGADDQCAQYRTGLLCSMCKAGYSLSAGSTRCISCHTYYHLFAVLLCLGIVGFGIVLVILMLILNLTVAVGTINGIIFYANIVSTNSSIFLPFSGPNPLTVFIALLNLKIGFDTCLYKGMNAYVQTWLLFAHPAYLITLMVVIILLCKYSSRFSQLIGKRNPVATLATLLLLFYTKLLQTVIRILSFARLNYPDGSQSIVWLPDASVAYFKGIHFPLFMMALLTIAVGLIYTIVLFAWQWLLQLPRSRLTSWIRNAKLNAFIYMYHVPYTAQHRYWTGLLLLTRIVLYLVLDLSDDPKFRLLAITLITTCLLLLKSILGSKVYKRKLMDYLDTMSIFNILVFSLVSFYIIGNESSQKSAAKLSIGSAIAMFLFIICYHLKLTLLEISLFKRKMDKIKQKILRNKSDRRFNRSGHGIEMNTESVIKVTSSEVCVSPAHTGSDHSIGDTDVDTSTQDNGSGVTSLGVYGDNDLREPLLL